MFLRFGFAGRKFAVDAFVELRDFSFAGLEASEQMRSIGF